VATITAGWRGDEAFDEALHDVVGHDAVSIPLYHWYEELADSEVVAAWRARQDRIRRLKRLHQERLHPALDAVKRLLPQTADDPELVRPQLRWALDQVRDIDDQFLEQSRTVVAEHPSTLRPWQHADVAPYRQRMLDSLRGARALAIAGGHVAVLRNRMFFFGLHELLPKVRAAGTAIVCWSAGAMALTDRIVLFYDDPPDGPSHPELLDAGFGFLDGMVLLPHARQRLRLHDQGRVALLASRFAPAQCITLENGAWLDRQGHRIVNRGVPGSALLLQMDGSVSLIPGAT